MEKELATWSKGINRKQDAHIYSYETLACPIRNNLKHVNTQVVRTFRAIIAPIYALIYIFIRLVASNR